MFGVTFIFMIIICAFITLCKDVKCDLENRKQYSDIKTNTYLAYDGNFRDLDTGKYRTFHRDKNGDLHMEGEDICDVNISQRQREENYKKGALPGRTTCFYSNEPALIHYGSHVKRGCRYKDYQTGELYVVRRDKKGHSFYVTFNNKVVRYTDSYIKILNKYGCYDKAKEKEAVENFQKRIDSVLNDDFWKKDPTLIECGEYGVMND